MAKTGGLADVSASLPAALARLGADMHLLMPGYEEALDRAEQLHTTGFAPAIPEYENVRILTGRSPDSGLPVSFVDIPELYRDGGGLYVNADGSEREDNSVRFAALTHAAAAMALGQIGSAWIPDIVHCNDWHTGLLPLLLRAKATGARPKTVFTVHNMAFQGLCPWTQFESLGLPSGPEITEGIEFYGQVNFLKAGLKFGDMLTTVSPTYAREIQTPEFGCGLEGVVSSRAKDLVGILNGIDTDFWNPMYDRWIAASYSRHDISGKRECKRALQRELGLIQDDNAPLLIFVGRLTRQKMADVLLAALPEILKRGGDRQLAILGQGDKALEDGFRNLMAVFPGRLSVHVGYSEDRAQRLHAGADMLIHGSRYEPCGLTQLYAMRYGTIPIVRPVGGLADTVVEVNDATISTSRATGFHFHGASIEDKLVAVDRAVAMYRQDLAWRRLQRAAMKADFSWDRSARQYLEVYTELRAQRLEGVGGETGVETVREIA
jgi:starch synthase